MPILKCRHEVGCVLDTQCSLFVSALPNLLIISIRETLSGAHLSWKPYIGFLNPQAKAETAAQSRLKMFFETEDKPGRSGQESLGAFEANSLTSRCVSECPIFPVKSKLLCSKLYFVCSL